MISKIETLRMRGIDSLAIGVIALYQRTVSAVTPSRCRYLPSCSQYGIEAIKEWGLVEGITLTRKRISRCKRPNGGFDPVPRKPQLISLLHKSSVPRSPASKVKLSKERLKSVDFQSASRSPQDGLISDYEHSFKVILSYPLEREFLSKEDLKQKIAEFNRYVLEVPSYSLLFKVSKVEVGEIGNYYLLRFAGSTSGKYLETCLDEVSNLITAQLASFLVAARANEFEALYFEIDGQVIIEAEPEVKAVPAGYSKDSNLWIFTDNSFVWDYYWGEFIVYSLIDLIDASVDANIMVSASSLHSHQEGCSLDLNPFDGYDSSGCDLNLNPFDGCDSSGCDLVGCDGCDGCSF